MARRGRPKRSQPRHCDVVKQRQAELNGRVVFVGKSPTRDENLVHDGSKTKGKTPSARRALIKRGDDTILVTVRPDSLVLVPGVRHPVHPRQIR